MCSHRLADSFCPHYTEETEAQQRSWKYKLQSQRRWARKGPPVSTSVGPAQKGHLNGALKRQEVAKEDSGRGMQEAGQE